MNIITRFLRLDEFTLKHRVVSADKGAFRKCPRCGQPDMYWHESDGTKALCEHCYFMLTEIYTKEEAKSIWEKYQ
jgi:hypothetical protein